MSNSSITEGLRVLRTAKDHETAIAEIERLMATEPPAGSEDAERLEHLAILVEAYERKRWDLTNAPSLDQRGTWRRVVQETIAELEGITGHWQHHEIAAHLLRLAGHLRIELAAKPATKAFVMMTAGRQGTPSYYVVQASDETRARELLGEEEPDETVIAAQDLRIDYQHEKVAYALSLYMLGPTDAPPAVAG